MTQGDLTDKGLAHDSVGLLGGTPERGVGLGNEETADNVFAALADPVLGGALSLLLFMAVLASSASSLQTTFIPAARTILAMSFYKALPDRLSKIHPTHRIPSYATLVSGIGTAIFYAVMTLVSEAVLVDTILSLGLMICFYYGLTAFAAAWYFRHELKDRRRCCSRASSRSSAASRSRGSSSSS